jgi:hypothetical protein
MGIVRVIDVVVPSIFAPYIIQRTKELSALWQSGIIANDPRYAALIAGGGRTFNLPYWADLTGSDEVLEDQGAGLTPGGISSGQDIAVLHMRGRAWGSNDLAGHLAGDDPMAAIGDLIAAYWARRMQTLLLSVLKGIFASTSMNGNKLDISGFPGAAALLSAETTIDARQVLGDARDQVIAMTMHSAAVSYLAKLDLIDYMPDSEGKPTVKSYLGMQIIEDDSSPVANGVYTSYLFGSGVIAYADRTIDEAVETERSALKGEDYLTNRRHFILHPKGVAWQDDTCTGQTPTNAECELSANWERVWENKAIPIIQFKYRLEEVAGS